MTDKEKLWERCGMSPEIIYCAICGLKEIPEWRNPATFSKEEFIQLIKNKELKVTRYEPHFIKLHYIEPKFHRLFKEYPKFTYEHRNALEEMLTNFEVSVGVDYVKYLVRNINSSFIATYDKTRDQAICALVNELLDNGILTVEEVKEKLL